jgi:hypothetical protein
MTRRGEESRRNDQERHGEGLGEKDDLDEGLIGQSQPDFCTVDRF